MEQPKYFKDLPEEVRVKFIKDTFIETYPFTKENLEDYEKNIDFKILSLNQKMKWDSEIIDRFIDKWDWIAIENNPIICEEVNLGLLYPEKVNIPKPKCECRKRLEFCKENKPCIAIWDESIVPLPKKESINPMLFGFIKFLSEDNSFGNFLLNSILQYDFLIDDYGDCELYYEEENGNEEDDYVPF